MSKIKLGKSRPLEVRKRISDNNKGVRNSQAAKTIIEDRYTGEILEFNTRSDAAKYLDCSRHVITRRVSSGELYKDRFIVTSKKK